MSTTLRVPREVTHPDVRYVRAIINASVYLPPLSRRWVRQSWKKLRKKGVIGRSVTLDGYHRLLRRFRAVLGSDPELFDYLIRGDLKPEFLLPRRESDELPVPWEEFFHAAGMCGPSWLYTSLRDTSFRRRLHSHARVLSRALDIRVLSTGNRPAMMPLRGQPERFHGAAPTYHVTGVVDFRARIASSLPVDFEEAWRILYYDCHGAGPNAAESLLRDCEALLPILREEPELRSLWIEQTLLAFGPWDCDRDHSRRPFLAENLASLIPAISCESDRAVLESAYRHGTLTQLLAPVTYSEDTWVDGVSLADLTDAPGLW